MKTFRWAAFLVLPLAAAALLPGCAAMDQVAQVGAAVAESSGAITKEQAQSITRSSGALAKAAEDFTPEQEYYIGRSVGAVIVNRYKPDNDPQANSYLNVLGQALAQASDRPETFGGYHFLVLESDEINAFATPGGLVFVSRGMLRLCRNEDQVAAVLAHEISHVQLRHGIDSIEKSRKTAALTILAAESAKTFGKKQLADLTKEFEGSINDITSTLVNNGYSRAFERDADANAVKILSRIGYDPNALVAMLREMEKRLKPGGPDFAKTHPSPASRIQDLLAMDLRGPASPPPPARQARFQKALGGV
ncbi:MAG: M48 family metalloprotease [Thermodesulfobacteriota bacterium]